MAACWPWLGNMELESDWCPNHDRSYIGTLIKQHQAWRSSKWRVQSSAQQTCRVDLVWDTNICCAYALQKQHMLVSSLMLWCVTSCSSIQDSRSWHCADGLLSCQWSTDNMSWKDLSPCAVCSTSPLILYIRNWLQTCFQMSANWWLGTYVVANVLCCHINLFVRPYVRPHSTVIECRPRHSMFVECKHFCMLPQRSISHSHHLRLWSNGTPRVC